MKRVVIVGAGFAGLAAAKELRHSDAEVFVVKRITTSFSICSIKWQQPCFLRAQIGCPVRGLLKDQRNRTVIGARRREHPSWCAVAVPPFLFGSAKTRRFLRSVRVSLPCGLVVGKSLRCRRL
jgi:hypothetical protein